MDDVTLGSASRAFLSTPAKLHTIEFLGVAFIFVVIIMHWSRFINDLER